MYKPKLKYFFVAERKRSIWQQHPLISYLNRFGIKPCFAGGNEEVYDIINKNSDVRTIAYGKHPERLGSGQAMSAPNIEVEFTPDDYDIMFSESYGIWAFEKTFLMNSKKWQKKNIILSSIISVNNVSTSADRHYTPDNTKFIDGFCLNDCRTYDYFYNHINKGLTYFITGNPEWDFFNSESMKKRVSEIRKKYGEKILVIGVGQFRAHPEQADYIKRIIRKAEEMDFKVVVNIHPDSLENAPVFLNDYILFEHRYVLFSSASHIICPIASGMTGEAFYLGKKVGSNPMASLGYRDPEEGKFHIWAEDFERYKSKMLPLVGDEVFYASPLVNDDTIKGFLEDAGKFYTTSYMDELFGWPRVDNYCEHLFKTIEEKYGE